MEDKDKNSIKIKGRAGRPGDSGRLYIGTPSGVVLCVDSVGGALNAHGKFGGDRAGIAADLSGLDACLWHRYAMDAVRVMSPDQMLREMEALFELINHPRATTTLRSFAENDRGRAESGHTMPGTPSTVPRYLSDDELLQKRGGLATFIIRVQQRQNSNWQGHITWVEREQTLRFSTIMEMLKMIGRALEVSCDAQQSISAAQEHVRW